MTAIELKQYIVENNLIKTITDDLGCHSFKEYTTEYRCGQPDRNSKNSIAIKKDTLKTKIFQSDSGIVRGDLFTLIMEIKKISFPEANRYLHKLFNLKYDYNKKNKNNTIIQDDPLDIFKKVKRRRNIVDINDVDIYDNSIIEEYEPILHISWAKEGILEFTRRVFNIGYSYKHKRIVIPHRYWCGDEDDYLGIMGRTTIEAYNLLDIPKYYPLKKFPKSINLYGLQENYKTIQEAGYCCVYESEKSPLKRHSRLDGTGVAISSHNLSDEQIKILIGLNIDIVICYDKDISLKHIRSECSKFYGIRNVYYVYDKHDLLKDKESPADAHNKIFNYLFKHKIKYDETEHKKHLKEMEDEKNK